jgi:hypothetical protein
MKICVQNFGLILKRLCEIRTHMLELIVIHILIFLGVVVAINIAEKRTSIFETSHSPASSSSVSSSSILDSSIS